MTTPPTDDMVAAAPAGARPFLSAPSARRYFPASTIEESRQRITQNVQRGSGVALVISGAGLGKSMLLEVLATQFSTERPVITLAGAQLCTRRALLQMILFQLGLPFKDLTEGELRLSILSHLQSQAVGSDSQDSRAGLLLLVDEAESLPVRLLEELRVLTNVAQGGVSLVDLVLAGGPALEEQLAERAMEALSQRLSVRCYLSPFGREETFQYVRSQVAAVDGDPAKFFTQDALEALFAATDGIPRLINQLGDQLAFSAEQTGTLPITGQMVQAAWAEIQQLPAPWNVQDAPLATTSMNASSIEVGELSEDISPVNQTISLGSDLDGSDDHQCDSADSNVFEFGGELPIEDHPEATDEALPASIPFTSTKPSLEISTDATIDATERLLAELGELGSSDMPAALTPSPQPAVIRNLDGVEESDDVIGDVFGDGFHEEEIVIDQYANFESGMLAFAPDVMNFMDLGFAQELDFYSTTTDAPIETKPVLSTLTFNETDDELDAEIDPEIQEEPAAELVIEDETLEVIEPTELDEVEDEFTTLTASSDEEDEYCFVEAALSTQVAPAMATETVPTDKNKLLILEDDGRGSAEVVPGRQFRRLFSTLEAGS
ncbi:ExeA family protein [Adhaeretor mobilis]|uniref:ORC1/DEAH AAA+ ATPase domain-containing protein n=1 Tax=Adhaeretor mobilis TaxID=1930276 RepID=A0A517MSS7_9BACT|nr:AAA family ATPase [Adhaeretor mobilis]QDS97941.1 hypothetical protein HG15A2_12100 [Adhaeretor mobilis]